MNTKVFLVWLLLFVLINSSCSSISIPTNEIYLIQKGYRGDVIILFNQPDGIVPETEKFLYVYKIPADGILKIKTSGVTGIVKKSYYLFSPKV